MDSPRVEHAQHRQRAATNPPKESGTFNGKGKESGDGLDKKFQKMAQIVTTTSLTRCPCNWFHRDPSAPSGGRSVRLAGSMTLAGILWVALSGFLFVVGPKAKDLNNPFVIIDLVNKPILYIDAP